MAQPGSCAVGFLWAYRTVGCATGRTFLSAFRTSPPHIERGSQKLNRKISLVTRETRKNDGKQGPLKGGDGWGWSRWGGDEWEQR